MNPFTKETKQVESSVETVLQLELKKEDFKDVLEDKDDQIAELREIIASYEEEDESFAAMLEAIQDFCAVCPLRDAISQCLYCFLNPWK